ISAGSSPNRSPMPSIGWMLLRPSPRAGAVPGLRGLDREDVDDVRRQRVGALRQVLDAPEPGQPRGLIGLSIAHRHSSLIACWVGGPYLFARALPVAPPGPRRYPR